MLNLPLLSIEIWLPIISGVFLLIWTRGSNNLEKGKAKTDGMARNIALAVSILSLLICIPLLKGFDHHSFEMQWTEQISWIPSLGIQYALGVDGFSLPLIILTDFMTILVVLSSHSVKSSVTKYLAAFLIMQGLINGALAAQDAILFYFFWEAMLVPMFLIIGIWGAENRIYATIKFFLYTFLGSVLLLISLIYLHVHAVGTGIPLEESFNILIFQQMPLDLATQKWLFIALFLAFAVKVPMWPIHTWLPDAHVEAPTGGSVILAAILLKMGAYGFLRFLLPILPNASLEFSWPVIVLSLIAIVYIAFVAIVQRDMKKLIAYSSISHMGFVTLAFFLVYPIVLSPASTTGDIVSLGSTANASMGALSQTAVLGITGALIQMISHGFVSGALFLCVGVLYDRRHSRLIKDYGGVVNTMPIFASFFMVFALANIGLPGTSGFVGEFFIILSAFKAKFWYALLAGSILILGAAYTLWMVKRVVLGPVNPGNPINIMLMNQIPMYSIHHPEAASALMDLNKSETLVFSLLVLAIVCLGLWPDPLVDLVHASSRHLVEQMFQLKIPGG